MEALERAQARLDNIHSVLPILGALRTISLGNWQTAKKQMSVTHNYQARLLSLISWLLPLAGCQPHQFETGAGCPPHLSQGGVLVVALGSERGLCGRFNLTIVKHVEQYLGKQTQNEQPPELLVVGNRLAHLIQHQHPAWLSGSRSLPIGHASRIPTNASSSVRLAFDLTHTWLDRYEAHELDVVEVIYNSHQEVGRYEPRRVRLIPPQLPVPDEAAPNKLWPPPIIETNPVTLYARVVEQWIALKFYGLLLESAITEHSARYQLMEAATKNAERLIDELTIVVQTARQQTITQEMQMLAAGAGLIGS